jgi:hypothetical protein
MPSPIGTVLTDEDIATVEDAALDIFVDKVV